MRLPPFTRISLAVALVCGNTGEVRAQAFELDLANTKWTALSPKDTAVRFAILRVDSVSGATQMLYRLPPNTASPCHWHTASQGTLVLRGSLTLRRAGLHDGATLGVGGYSYMPGGEPFQLTTGPTATVLVASLDAAFDIHAAPAEHCAASTPVGSRNTGARAFELDLGSAPWESFPTKDSPVRIAMLRVDSASGATHMLFRIPPNAVSPCHWHTPAEHNTVVQGSAGMQHPGMAKGPELGVGGFSFVPGRMPHQIMTGPTPTLVFSTLDGRFDYHVMDTSQCR